MNSDLWSFLDASVVTTVLAVFGGIARACRFGISSWGGFVSGLVVSAFTGNMIALLIADANISQNYKYAVIGVSGYVGGAILDALSSLILRKISESGPDGNKG
ncbi:MAG: phage holin family protein [Desulfovibrionaceae bacterium]|nr:phage holin family protein [Desulfovibrionaceae bacterium]